MVRAANHPFHIFLLFPLMISLASAQVTLSISPSHQTVLGRMNFTVNVTMDPSGNSVAGWQFNFTFDPSVVKADSVTVYNIFPCDHAYSSGSIDNSQGIIMFIYSAALGKGCNTTSSATLATIQMYAEEVNDVESNLNLTDVKISDPNATSLNVITSNGTVAVNYPFILILNPKNGSTVREKNVEFTVTDRSGLDHDSIQVILNGQQSPSFEWHICCPDYSDTYIHCSYTEHGISEGGNTIMIRASDTDGHPSELWISFIYQVPTPTSTPTPSGGGGGGGGESLPARTPTPTPTFTPTSTPTPVTIVVCSPGYKCKDEYMRAYQHENCSWSHEEFCEYGCVNGVCMQPTKTEVTPTPTKAPGFTFTFLILALCLILLPKILKFKG